MSLTLDELRRPEQMRGKLSAFEGRILNTHPALLPRFGGPGMYGDRVFEAVLEAGEAESGISIHLVDADYDSLMADGGIYEFEPLKTKP